MVGMKRVAASSLIEVTVALVIFMLLLTLSLSLILRGMDLGRKRKVLYHDSIISEQVYQTKLQKRFIDEEVKVEGVRISQRVSKYKENLLLLEVCVIDANEDTLRQHSELIYYVAD